MYSTRLKQLKKTLKLTTEQLAMEIGMPARTLGSYERGESKVPLELLTKLCNKYSLNPEWLALGTGEMFVSQTENTLIKCDNSAFLENKDTFHKHFNKLQAENKLNDYEMSKLLDISESRIEKLGIGKAEPTFEELCKIKAHFDVSIDWLLFGDAPYKSAQSEGLTLSADEIAQLKLLAKKFKV